MSKHTPGPWKVKGSNIYSVDSTPIAQPCINAGIDSSEANARLIAAAPDMFTALERVREAWGDAIRDNTEIDVFDLVDWLGSWYNLEVMPALRKARGEE